MIKVLRIINRFNLGGPTYNVAYLTKYLSDDFETLLVGGVEDITEAASKPANIATASSSNTFDKNFICVFYPRYFFHQY